MMAISPPCHLGSEFPREAILNTTEDDNRWGLQSPVDQPPPPVIRCSIEKIAAKINSCAKARVLAIIAFNLLVFDGQLSKDRLNWACPFGHCKLGFVEKHELMEHILDCPDFSSDEVFCNCCTKDDRFQEHCRQNRAENIASHGNDKNSSKKRSRIRKLSSMFSRRGTESKSPPPSPGYPVSPVSTGRRASLPPLITPLPSPSNASRKVSSPASQVSCTDIFETPSPAQPETSRELIGSEPHIVPELQELATVEAPGELFGSTMMAQELPGAILNDMDFCESSTTADLPTYSMLHDQHAFRAGNTSLGQQIEASHVEPGPTNGLDSAFQPQGQHQPSWLVHLHLQQLQQQQQQASWLDPGSQVSPANVQEGMCSSGGFMRDRSFSFFAQHSHQPGIVSPSPNHIGDQGVKDSGDSVYSVCSSATMALEHTPQLGSAHQSSFNAGHLTGSALPSSQASTASTAVAAQPAPDQELRCQHPGCNYSPSGDRREKYPHYLRKHNKTHLGSYRVPCLQCGRWLSRSDNLKVHRGGTACSRTRPHQPRRRSRTAQRRGQGSGQQGE